MHPTRYLYAAFGRSVAQIGIFVDLCGYSTLHDIFNCIFVSLRLVFAVVFRQRRLARVKFLCLCTFQIKQSIIAITTSRFTAHRQHHERYGF